MDFRAVFGDVGLQNAKLSRIGYDGGVVVDLREDVMKGGKLSSLSGFSGDMDGLRCGFLVVEFPCRRWKMLQKAIEVISRLCYTII